MRAIVARSASGGSRGGPYPEACFGLDVGACLQAMVWSSASVPRASGKFAGETPVPLHRVQAGSYIPAKKSRA